MCCIQHIFITLWVQRAFTFVSLDRGGLTESFFTKLTLEWSFPSMRSLVSAKARLFVKAFVANQTEVRFLFGVLLAMKNDRVPVCKPICKILLA